MIRINLLGRARPKVRRRVAITGGLQLLLFIIPVGLAIVFLVVHYFMIEASIRELEEQVAQKQAEKRELAQVEAEIKQLEAERSRLQQQKTIIDNLRQNQQGPVRLLATVGDTVSLTETLWLTEMEETGENQIQFTGRASSVNEVANFITRLNQSGSFRDVEIKESVEQPGEEGRPPTFEFVLTARFIPPAQQQQQAAGEAAPQAAGGGEM